MKAIDWHRLWVPEVSPWEVVLRAALVFAFLLVALRIVGRKELTRWSKSDVVLLILLSQAVRETLVVHDPSLTTSFLSLATLLGLEWLASWAAYRSPAAGRWLNGSRRLVVQGGRPLPEPMRRSRLTRDDLLANVRDRGMRDLEEVEEGYVEPNGRLTFVRKKPR